MCSVLTNERCTPSLSLSLLLSLSLCVCVCSCVCLILCVCVCVQICILHSDEFGLVALVPIGASMVSSINIVAKEGDVLEKGDEHGYFGSVLFLFFFRFFCFVFGFFCVCFLCSVFCVVLTVVCVCVCSFGGSTVLLLFQTGRVRFDDDLIANSMEPVETLVRAGMRIGVATQPGKSEFEHEAKR